MKVRQLLPSFVAPDPDRVQKLMTGDFGVTLYDYAIVRLKLEASEPLGSNGASGRCLRRLSLDRGDSIYVVGYPRGERVRVHDYARVYLPFRVLDGELFMRLRLDVEADLVGEPDRNEQMRHFDESFQKSQEGALMFRRFYDVRDGGQPRMGIVAVAFRGDSGGPVFDHQRDQCVVGILNRGMPDTGVRLTANFKQHERVLPMQAILDDLAKNPSTKVLLTNGELDLR
jgi:hypothetical protein